jgi:Family of unknown function (DUF6049)
VRRARSAAALLAVLVLAGLGLTVPAAPAGAAGEPGLARVAISTVTPPSPGPADTFVVVGRAVNAGSTPILGVSVRLRIDPLAITSRDALAEAASDDIQDNPADADLSGVSIDSSVVTNVADSLAAGGSTAFRISLPAADLQLSDFGVYPLTIEVRSLGADGQRATVGAVRTFIVYRGSTPVPTVRLSWLIPLQDRPLRDVNGRYDATGAGTLADSLDSGGRLDTLLAAGAGEPITWAVDPDLLEEAAGLAAGAPLSTGGTSTPDDGAASWVAALKAAKEVRALPYGDPDLTAQRRASLAGDLAAEVSTGTGTATRALGRTISPAPAWPVDGVTTPGTLTGIAGAGLSQVVLSGAAVRTPATETATPDALGALSGTALQVITSDPTLTSLATTDPRQLGNNTLARLRLLAETAMVAAEKPSNPRSVVIALPRDWAPQPGWARLLLTMDQVAPWIVPVDLTALTADPGAGPVRRLVPYPDGARANEVSADQLKVVRQTSSRLQRFTSILTNPDEYGPAYTAVLQRGESAGWRGDVSGGQAYVQAASDSLLLETRKVQIQPRGEVTLSSRTGRVPLAVHNGLTQDVRVAVDLTATPAFRLRMGKEVVRTVPAGSTSSFEVPASTSTDGRILVAASLSTPGGETFGSPVSFQLRATGYGRWAHAVASVLVVLLGLALIVRVIRRIRAGAAAADAAARDVIAEEAGQR